MLPRFIVSVEGVTLGKCLIGVSTEGRYIISPPTESFLLLIYHSCRKNPSAIGADSTEVANDDFAFAYHILFTPPIFASTTIIPLSRQSGNAIFVPFIVGSLENSKYQHIPLAEGKGLEPSNPLRGSAVFKTAALPLG